jgi:histidine triad (HIT) family protein
MSDCIFCKIIANELPCNKVYEDEFVLAFHDIDPSAETHVLVIPKQHIATLADLDVSHEQIMTKFTMSIPMIAKKLGLKGFKTLINTGKEGGQIVFHIHAHILGGNIKKSIVG